MKLQFIKMDKAIPFDCCPCTGHNFDKDCEFRDVTTIDNVSFSSWAKPAAKETCQFPYTYMEFDHGLFDNLYSCTKCHKIPYRIIKKRKQEDGYTNNNH
jgi:hypothetical protein